MKSTSSSSRRRTAVVIAAVTAVLVGGLLAARACIDAIETAVTAPEGVWIREARIEGPRRAPPEHALYVDVNGTQPAMIVAEDEQGIRVLVRCSDRESSRMSCTLPARAATFRVWLTGPCRDAPLRKGSMGGWLCDAPPDASVSVRTSLRGAWERTESSQARLVVPQADGGVYADIEVLVTSPAGIEPEVRFGITRPNGDGIVINVPWWPATCSRTSGGVQEAGSRMIRCRVSAGELSGATGELGVLAEANVLGVCPTEAPCAMPPDAVVRVEVARVVSPQR